MIKSCSICYIVIHASFVWVWLYACRFYLREASRCLAAEPFGQVMSWHLLRPSLSWKRRNVCCLCFLWQDLQALQRTKRVAEQPWKRCIKPTVSVFIMSNVKPLQDEYVREIFFFNMARCLLWRRVNCQDHPFDSAYLLISFASEDILHAFLLFAFWVGAVQAAMENGYGSAPSRAITLQAEAPISKSADEMFLILSFFPCWHGIKLAEIYP